MGAPLRVRTGNQQRSPAGVPTVELLAAWNRQFGERRFAGEVAPGADEGAGAFLRLCQFDESQKPGEVVIDIDELDLIRDIGRKIIEELPGEKEWSDA